MAADKKRKQWQQGIKAYFYLMLNISLSLSHRLFFSLKHTHMKSIETEMLTVKILYLFLLTF